MAAAAFPAGHTGCVKVFGNPATWPADDMVGWSAELSPELVLAGYREGVFPMPVEDVFGWFSPLQRGILPLDGLRVTRSMRRSAQRYRTTLNQDCAAVMAGCADPRRPGGWIDEQTMAVYLELHDRGFVHSIEVWDPHERLVGGLYGVWINGFFAGESMFHDPEYGTDASKVALMSLVALLVERGVSLLDVQWSTDHLARLGVIEVPRQQYLRLLASAVRV